MPSKMSLAEMPDVAMKRILDKCDFLSIQVLRKTCHNIRNFIDDQKRDPKILWTFVEVRPDLILLKVYFDDIFTRYPYGKTCAVQYQKRKNDCHITWFTSIGDKTKVIKKDYVQTFCDDFKNFVQNQKSEIETFAVDEFFEMEAQRINSSMEEVLSKFKNVLKTSPRPLPVKNFEMMVSKVDHIMQILPHVDSEKLNKIRMASQRKRGLFDTWNIDRLMELDQWKKAIHLETEGVLLSAAVQKYLHFGSVELYSQRITVDYLTEWKNALLNPGTLKYVEINGDPAECVEGMGDAYGPALGELAEDGSIYMNWFFNVRNNDDLLLQLVFCDDSIVMGYVPKEETDPRIEIVRL